MAEYEVSRGMPAVSEVVFSTMADVERLESWLPPLIDVEPSGPDAAHVESEVGGHHEAEGLFRASPDQLRVEWAHRGTDDYAGWLQVADSGAGSSEVTLHLSFADDGAPARHASGQPVEQWMRDALDQLADQVGRRVNDAS
jgi:hypothetical protein